MEDSCERLLREGRHQGVLPRHEGRRRARPAALEDGRRHGGESATSALTVPQDSSPGEPSPDVLARRRAARRQTALRQKELGIWQSRALERARRLAREVGMGLVALGFEPGEVASILSNTNREWIFADLGMLGAGGVATASTRPTPPRRSSTCSPIRARSRVRRGRGAARQGARGARARCRALRRSSCSTWKGCSDFSDPMVISLDELRALGPRLHQRSTPASGERDRTAASPTTWRS